MAGLTTAAILGISAAASAASGVASAALNKPKPSTSSYDNTSTTSGTSTTTRNLTPQQEALQGPLSALALDKIANPAARLEPLRQVSRAQVNNNFSGADEAIRAKLGRSGAKSGKLGTAVRQTELSRLGAISDVDTNFSNQILNEQESGIGLAERLLSQNYGQTVTSNGTTTGSGTGTNTAAPIGGLGVAGNAINAGLDTATTLMMINQMLKKPVNYGARYA